MANLPWTLDSNELQSTLGIEQVNLLNDLEATAYSLALLEPSEISLLNQGVAVPHATQALLAAGTGLGEAILFWAGFAGLP